MPQVELRLDGGAADKHGDQRGVARVKGLLLPAHGVIEGKFVQSETRRLSLPGY